MKNLKGFTLFLTVIVLSVIFILCGLVLLFLNNNSKICNDYFRRIHNSQIIESNIDILISNELYSASNNIIKKDNSINEIYWGSFKKGLIITDSLSDEGKRSFLFGYTPTDYALYLKNNQEPLNIAGNVSINGKIYISEFGINRSFIDDGDLTRGHAPLSNLTLNTSKTFLPEIDTNQINYYKKMLFAKNELLKTYTNVHYNSSLEEDIFNSFFDPLIIYYFKNTTTLSNIKLIGNILLISDAKIIIKNTANLKDIWLIAKEIETENDLYTVAHLLSENITIGKNNHFLYPSSLIVLNSGKIIIQNNSKIEGNIVVYQFTENTTNPGLICEENSEIIGSVYCNGLSSVSGKIIGNITSSGFVTYTLSGIYNNTLKDIEINRNKLPEYFVSGSLVQGDGWGIVKWLK